MATSSSSASACVSWQRRPKQAAELARKGRDYVLANYTWPSVLDAMERSLEAFLA